MGRSTISIERLLCVDGERFTLVEHSSHPTNGRPMRWATGLLSESALRNQLKVMGLSEIDIDERLAVARLDDPLGKGRPGQLIEL
jgi:hypothetical protein